MAYTPITPYADSTFGDAYFGERVGSDTWDAAISADKNKALKNATVIIDQLPLIGDKCDEDDAREFPRLSDDGCIDESGDIPEEVQEACCEVAIALLDGKTPDALASGIGIASEGTGDANVSYTGDRGDLALMDENFGLPSVMAARLLAPWLEDSSTIDLSRV